VLGGEARRGERPDDVTAAADADDQDARGVPERPLGCGGGQRT
jgi:hypothetical protein